MYEHPVVQKLNWQRILRRRVTIHETLVALTEYATGNTAQDNETNDHSDCDHHSLWLHAAVFINVDGSDFRELDVDDSFGIKRLFHCPFKLLNILDERITALRDVGFNLGDAAGRRRCTATCSGVLWGILVARHGEQPTMPGVAVA